MANNNQPIIIKRIKKGGHGHHGGAWKVAYADFVTAMMAFFLLLWLVSVSTQEQRSGLADYFTPTQGIKDAVGIGMKGGVTASDQGERRDNKSNPGIVVGGMQIGATPDVLDKKSMIESTADANLFENTMDRLKRNIESDPDLQTFKENIEAKVTPDGLKIDVSDSDKYPMYEQNSGKLTPFGEAILKKMGELVKSLPNHITITGNTDAGKVEKEGGYTNWELSTDRANAARKFMGTMLEPDRVSRVIGAADKDLILPSSPTSPKNRRISILLLRGSYMEGQGNPDAIRDVLTPSAPVDTSKLGDPLALKKGEAEKAAGDKAPADAKAPDNAHPDPAPTPASDAPAVPQEEAPPPTPAPRSGVSSLPGVGATQKGLDD